jgi:hypothetical protein
MSTPNPIKVNRRAYSADEVAEIAGAGRGTVYECVRKTGVFAGIPAIFISKRRFTFAAAAVNARFPLVAE